MQNAPTKLDPTAGMALLSSWCLGWGNVVRTQLKKRSGYELTGLMQPWPTEMDPPSRTTVTGLPAPVLYRLFCFATSNQNKEDGTEGPYLRPTFASISAPVSGRQSWRSPASTVCWKGPAAEYRCAGAGPSAFGGPIGAGERSAAVLSLFHMVEAETGKPVTQTELMRLHQRQCGPKLQCEGSVYTRCTPSWRCCCRTVRKMLGMCKRPVLSGSVRFHPRIPKAPEWPEKSSNRRGPRQ